MEEIVLRAEGSDKERIDKFLSGELTDLSRSHLQKLLKDGYVTVNGNVV